MQSICRVISSFSHQPENPHNVADTLGSNVHSRPTKQQLHLPRHPSKPGWLPSRQQTDKTPTMYSLSHVPHSPQDNTQSLGKRLTLERGVARCNLHTHLCRCAHLPHSKAPGGRCPTTALFLQPKSNTSKDMPDRALQLATPAGHDIVHMLCFCVDHPRMPSAQSMRALMVHVYVPFALGYVKPYARGCTT